MEEHIPPVSYRTGLGEIVEPANGFIYEVTKYAIYKNEARVELIESKFIKCSKEVKFRTKIIMYPEYKVYISATLIGAPLEYLKYLPLFVLKKKKK